MRFISVAMYMHANALSVCTVCGVCSVCAVSVCLWKGSVRQSVHVHTNTLGSKTCEAYVARERMSDSHLYQTSD